MPTTPDWPHAPPHRLAERGTYFITAATYKKQHLFQTRDRLDLLQRGLLKPTSENNWQLEAWAIFSNHYHLIASPSENTDPSSLSQLITELHSRSARWINRLDNQPGRKVWHNYWDTHLTYQNSYYARLNYVHNNPVRHNLVLVADQYPWCSASWFKRTAEPSFFKTIQSFKTDRITVQDDFQPQAPQP